MLSLLGAYAIMNWELCFHTGNNTVTRIWRDYNLELLQQGHLRPISPNDVPHGLYPLPQDVQTSDISAAPIEWLPTSLARRDNNLPDPDSGEDERT